MDHGSEVFAKLPNPNAGPAQLTVASEVATRDMLCEAFGIPIPKVLAWSCDAIRNSVDAEFILEEKAPRIRLGSVVDLEKSLTSITFDIYGYIYYRSDLRSLVGEAKETNTSSIAQGIPKKYLIRPLKRVDTDIESETLHKYYEAQENRDLFFLRESLMAKEQEKVNGIGQMIKLFRDQGVLLDFDIARENHRKYKEIFVRLGQDDEERELFRNLWPYQDSQ
ncbi:phosphotransferase enzyme family protein [Penicillium capsulatum]|uniref:Phosphotransferase enzyme family protein n=1 Tax=Penicillium capsulatum TaxID=69766 RepID=A0A9W9HZY7_9EURO|nr:phosphotransferase enzyme family protein [Penicillium capsulatum]KAJ6116607.1 phosphotransferase enzyme family protein [Penicillium capsulatum]